MLLFLVFLYTACLLLLAHQIFLLFSPPVAESADMWRNCLAANVRRGSMWFILNMTPKNLFMSVSARKCTLHYSSLRHGALWDGVLSWPHHCAIASPLLCHAQGKAQLPTPLSVSLDTTSTGAFIKGHSKHTTNRHCHRKFYIWDGASKEETHIKAWQIWGIWITSVVDAPLGFVASKYKK